MSLPAEKQKEYDATIDFLEKTSSIIKIFHSFLPIKDINDDRLKEVEALLGWFTDWQLESHNAPATVSERKKMMISDKTLFDLQSMVIGFQGLSVSILQLQSFLGELTPIWWRTFSANKGPYKAKMTTHGTYSIKVE